MNISFSHRNSITTCHYGQKSFAVERYEELNAVLELLDLGQLSKSRYSDLLKYGNLTFMDRVDDEIYIK